MRDVGASPGRSGHRRSVEAGRIIFETRDALAQLLGVEDPLRIIFTSNATEALNLALRGTLHIGDHAITSSMEHNSVMRPLRALEREGVEVSVVDCSSDGFIDPRTIEKNIKRSTRLIVISHASNVTGTLLPVAEVGEIARRHGVLLLVDAAQTVGSYPIDVETMNIDILAFSGHKGLYGPQGTGGLYLRRGLSQELRPLKYGGTGSQSEYEYQPRFLPDKYESGTPNTPGLAGLGAGVRFVQSKGISNIQIKEERLTQLLLDGLKEDPGIIVYGSGDARKRVAVVSFNIFGLTASEVAMQLEEYYHIMCRPGLHCAPVAHKTISSFPYGTVRLSLGCFTTRDDIVTAVEAVRKIAAGKGMW